MNRFGGRPASGTEGGFALRPAVIVWPLGVSQIVGYGTLYYSFSILAGDAAAAFGWPVSWLYGSFSLGLLAGAFIAPEAGRRIDRHNAGRVMAAGSVVCAATLAIAAGAPNGAVFAAAMVASQIAATLVLYDAAFAALVQASGPEARKRITQLTLIAGFASTIFWPFTSWLHAIFDWREVYFGFAAANLVVCLPIHVLLLRHQVHARRRATALPPPPATHAEVPPERQRRTMWLVTLGFALSGFALSAVLAQMVPLLVAFGLGGSALVVSTLFGPSQVLIRFGNMMLGARRHPIAAALAALALIPLALLVLTVSAPLTIGAVVFAILLGFGSGLKSIVQGTLPLALFGSHAYGARLGRMASVRQALAAVAPFTLAFLMEQAGPAFALAAVAAVGLVGFGCLVEVARTR